LTSDYASLADHNQKTAHKLDAAKARGTVLEKENGKLKSQMKVLLGKADMDNQLVDALRGELKQVRSRLRTSMI
jgi:hypothetical protein